MSYRHLLLAALGGGAMLLAAGSAMAGVDPCPTGLSYGASESGCQIDIVFSKSGAMSVVGNSPTPYITEDVTVGIINNTGHTISSLNLTSSQYQIFGFDGDGIDGYVPIANNSWDNTGYGGPNAYFSNISANQQSGTVNFINPVAAGGTDYFSLEDQVSYEDIAVHTPEPATIGLFAAGLLGLAMVRRRRA